MVSFLSTLITAPSERTDTSNSRRRHHCAVEERAVARAAGLAALCAALILVLAAAARRACRFASELLEIARGAGHASGGIAVDVLPWLAVLAVCHVSRAEGASGAVHTGRAPGRTGFPRFAGFTGDVGPQAQDQELVPRALFAGGLPTVWLVIAILGLAGCELKEASQLRVCVTDQRDARRGRIDGVRLRRDSLTFARRLIDLVLICSCERKGER